MLSATARFCCATLVAGLLTIPAEAAEAPTPPDGGFALPLDCTLQQNCWILNYVDTDPGPKARDSLCKARTYNGHKGTDFAIRDLTIMNKGVTVRAAASGTVLRIRNNAADKIDPAAKHRTKGLDCGNGIVLRHSGGWETQYCHLRKGSITVRPGDPVRRDQSMGLVGLSGRTEFPHVHLSVRHAGRVFDPVTDRLTSQPCGPNAKRGLTPRPLIYRPSEMYAVGFSAHPPTARGLKRDASERRDLPSDAPALILWGAMFGTEAGQTLTIEIKNPDGTVLLRQENTVQRGQAWRMAFAGKKRRQGLRWPPGQYTGTVTLSRAASQVSRGNQRLDLSAIFSRKTNVTIR